MLVYLGRKLLLLLPTLVGISIVSFALIRILPSDPIALLAGDDGLTPERHAQLMQQYGFDRPLWQQYLDYVWRLLQGDFGTSIVTRRPVLEDFVSFFSATLELGICALVIGIGIGLPLGVISAVKRGSWFDQITMSVALIGYSMPVFWWGLLLVIFFSGTLGWTPVSGRIGMVYYFPTPTGFMLIDSLLSGQPGAFRSAVSHLILPTLVLATIPLAVIARQARSAMLEVLNEDYVRTARAKGLGPFLVVGRHALRNGLIPILTVIGLQIGGMVSGAILTETIFSWPGIGKWIVDSIMKRDYPVVQCGLFMIAVAVMVVNLLVDFLYAVVNPRIRHV